MNRNNFHNVVHKIAKHFGSKPKFLFYDIKKNKYEFIDMTKKYCHPQLIFINGIPLTKIVGLLRFGFHNTGWGDGLIWCKDKVQKTVLLFLLNRDGEYVKDWEVKGNRLKDLEQFKEEAIALSKERFVDINKESDVDIVDVGVNTSFRK